jgi:multimeric flavodoxin WrbA
MTKPKILAISGSPHKRGNSYKVLSSLKELYPNVDYKLIMLYDMDLKPCRGCYMCVRRGSEICPLKDDRDKILKEIEEADGLIISSSVYVNTFTSLMKSFIERMGYNSHRPRFYGKFAIIVSVCAMFGGDNSNEYISGMFRSFGYDIVKEIVLEISLKSDKEKKYNEEKLKAGFDALLAAIEKEQPKSPMMDQYVRFHLFKIISGKQPDYYPADFEYYKDKTTLPIDGKISPFKDKMAKRVASNLFKKYMKNR